MLTVTPFSPAAFSDAAFSFSNAPFVVIATPWIPSVLDSMRTSFSTSFLTRGSPPLTRTRRTPILATIAAIRAISSKLRTSDWSSQMGFSGMQKSHLKLHRSVTETLSLLANLPNES